MANVIHTAGLVVRVGNMVSQRCALCGGLLYELDLDTIESSGDTVQVPVLSAGAVVSVQETLTLFTLASLGRSVVSVSLHGQEYDREDDLPPGSCLLGGRRSIKLVGGPGDGGHHHVQKGFPVPDRFGVKRGKQLHWYTTDPLSKQRRVPQAVFEKTENPE